MELFDLPTNGNALRKKAEVYAMSSRVVVLIIMTFCSGVFASDAAAKPQTIRSCGVITESGAYELQKNLTAPAGCLQVNANDVEIDLAGHTITGPGPAGSSGTGIYAPADGFTVHDGTVRDFNGHGIVGGARFRIERVKLYNNTGHGVGAADDSIVKDCIAKGNGGYGLNIGGPAIVTGNVVSGNGTGISVSTQSLVTNNTATLNAGDGIVVSGTGGFGSKSTILNNNAANNAGAGIQIDCPSHVVGNTALANGGVNLVLNGTGCASTDNLAP